MPHPANTPMSPEKCSGRCPALSRASQATSRRVRCWGSMMAASLGPKPKNSASKRSKSSSGAPRGTYDGDDNSAVVTPASSSSSSR